MPSTAVIITTTGDIVWTSIHPVDIPLESMLQCVEAVPPACGGPTPHQDPFGGLSFNLSAVSWPITLKSYCWINTHSSVVGMLYILSYQTGLQLYMGGKKEKGPLKTTEHTHQTVVMLLIIYKRKNSALGKRHRPWTLSKISLLYINYAFACIFHDNPHHLNRKEMYLQISK